MSALYMIVHIEGQKFAVSAGDIQCIADFLHWTPVQGAPPMIVGMATRRSQIITLIQLGLHPGNGKDFTNSHFGQTCRAMIFAHNGYDYGIIISGAVDSSLSDADVLPAPKNIAAEWRDMISGLVSINREFVPVLSVKRAIQAIINSKILASV